MKNLFESLLRRKFPKYKIIERIYGNKTSEFQIYKSIEYFNWVYQEVENSLERAETYVLESMQNDRARTVINSKVHNTDETWLKLKQKG